MVRTIGTSSLAVCLVALLMSHNALGQERSAGKAKTPITAKSTRAKSTEKSSSQERSTTSTTATKQSGTDIDTSPKKRSRRRLPRYFGQLDLDKQQREDVYSIQERYQQQLDDLENRIAVLMSERDAKVRKVLKPTQKRRLSSLVSTTRSRTKPASSPRP